MRKEKRTSALQKAEPAPETAAARIPFEELIAGEYAEDFRKKREEILGEQTTDAKAGYTALLRSVEEARRVYPDFDLRRELRSPRFAAMVLRGVDAKSAYEAVHHEALLQQAMAYGVQRTAEKLAAARIAARPAENGAEGQSASVARTDPRSLTKAQREELRRRVIERGERVTF